MVSIPKQGDPTLDAMRQACELIANDGARRDYIGASSIGNECARQLWYDYNKFDKKPFDAASLFRFEDGHRTEDLMIERLRLVPGMEVWTKDDNGKQFGFSQFNGKFRGHVDGVIRGLVQAPKTVHVLEIKCSEKLNEFRTIKLKHGEKATLKAWNNVYFVQAQIYMHELKIDRHYTIVASPGGRDFDACRTEYQPEVSQQYKDRAFGLLQAKEPPPRISDKADFFLCRWCAFNEECHK